MNRPDESPKNSIIIYTTEDGLTKIDATFDGDTVWLSIDQMAELFQRDRSVIGKHVRNIFKEGELQKESVWAKFAYTAADGKVYDVDYYNLDVIISVGYRVKSKRGTQFRIWATGILKEYMRKGFALDDERLKNLGGGGYFKELLERHKIMLGAKFEHQMALNSYMRNGTGYYRYYSLDDFHTRHCSLFRLLLLMTTTQRNTKRDFSFIQAV